MSTARMVVPTGFYGKLPSHGDFLQRRVSDAFVRAWDTWLQASLAASREALGERWLDIYLTSPVWRFASAAGACGPHPLVGVMAPSVDRVGRYFPLTVVAELPPGTVPLAAAAAAGPFFERAEQLVVETLAADPVDFERFDEAVAALGGELPQGAAGPSIGCDPAMLCGHGGSSWQLEIGSAGELPVALNDLLGRHLAVMYEPLVIWCTDGSSIVEPSGLVTQGLPNPDLFAGLLDGAWGQRRWQCVPALAGTGDDEGRGDVAGALTFRSAGASHTGSVRSMNQDAFLERPEVGIWAVADGMGGMQDGEVASRMVCDALADIVPSGSFDDAVEAVRQRLRQVNAHLVRAATRPVQAVHSGSTVVALLAGGERCAVLWAGDSRVYRWRNGEIEPLTRDHGLTELEVLAGGEPHAVTRAVGGEERLLLDERQERVRAGDRYLLCSDGLTRTVPETTIRSGLESGDLRGAVDFLVEAALQAGGADNVTVLVVEVCDARAGA